MTQRIVVFNNVSIDGWFADAQGSVGWAYAHSDPDFDAFVASNSEGGDTLLLGRVTWELMASWWPTPAALASNRVVAEQMNRMRKVVVSRTLREATWENSSLVRDDMVAAVRKLKAGPGGGIVVLGSGSVVAQLARAGLVDEYQLVVNPVVLGAGRSMFAGIDQPIALRLTESRTFASGKVLLCYAAAGTAA
jgi:dihydrofolate reductase